ncbi:hypothetical protein Mlaev_00035 [Microbacterium laevaniformans]|uniref:Uncharacterized protein n=1 Tax=Microbacterium laevaniformans TaxID=36807 RepID=A0A150HIX0_9MICO|nr:hypothetical protein [Microbacterium laevaniformans]KXZ61944.1 hypothetical protein Mlaev_00035 [Microbacterium laevaniformans]
MARVGGRNAAFAWVVGVACAATVGVLAFLAIPMIPASVSWLGDAAGRSSTSTPAAEATGKAASVDGVPARCADLYDEALDATLTFAPGAAGLTASSDAPMTTATQLVDALRPQVVFTCTWRADAGTVTTTLADVPTDAGPIAAAALPAAGFTCSSQGERTRCTRTDGDLTETIEAGGGRWLSTSERGWHPSDYVSRIAKRVWG